MNFRKRFRFYGKKPDSPPEFLPKIKVIPVHPYFPGNVSADFVTIFHLFCNMQLPLHKILEDKFALSKTTRKMKTLNFALCLAPALIGTAAGCTSDGSGRKDSRPNIIFILTDDQNFQTVHALGNRYIDTPNMDRIVRSGTAFTQAHVMGGLNGAVSQPSRAMLLTGRGLMDVHRNGSVIPQEEKTFPEMFREAGYTTFGTGKWHSDKKSFNRSFSTGANIFFGGMHNPGKSGELGHRRPFLHQYDSTGKYENGQWVKASDSTFSSELYADAAIKFIDSMKDSREPFLAYVAFTSPHDPRNVHPDYGKEYSPEEVPMPENFLTRHPFDTGDLTVRDEMLLPTPRDPEAVRQEVAFYYSMVNEVDCQIGRILDKLEETGLDKNTIIVFAADNGLAIGSHGLLGKQNLYEESVRIPLVFCGPGIPEGEKRDTYCYLYDIFPTLCDLTGNPIPESVKGKSLLPAIQENGTRTREALLLTYMNIQRAVKKDGYKLILYNVDGQRHPQLFDLGSDPYEKTNLYGNPDYAKVQESLTGLMYKMMEEAGDFCDPNAPDWGYPGKLTGEQVREIQP